MRRAVAGDARDEERVARVAVVHGRLLLAVDLDRRRSSARLDPDLAPPASGSTGRSVSDLRRHRGHARVGSGTIAGIGVPVAISPSGSARLKARCIRSGATAVLFFWSIMKNGRLARLGSVIDRAVLIVDEATGGRRIEPRPPSNTSWTRQSAPHPGLAKCG